MNRYALDLREIDPRQGALVGGKAAQLAELTRIEGVRVPAGWCVTTDAFDRVMGETPGIDGLLDRLSHLEPDDREAIRSGSAEIRRTLVEVAISDDLAVAITGPLTRLGERTAWAVRSSATAEDLPTASFAGQHDTYLNVRGQEAVLRHVARCWASLFTERAVSYRLRNSFDHRRVQMAVVVQQMVPAQAAGVLFTADPVSSNRKVVSVEATFGLGEALVSGLVNPDVYKVRDDQVVEKAVGTKRITVHALPGGGTRQRSTAPERREQPALTDAQVVRLAQLGRRIEAHFGYPQDIEWCLADDEFAIVQSRPITTLFPAPATDDGEIHVYVSVGHQQMMTDAMKPLGISVWQHTSPAPMREAGGRLFVDVTAGLASPASRQELLQGLGMSDPLIGDALRMVLERGDVIRSVPDGGGGVPPRAAPTPIATDPAIVAELVANHEASVAALQRDIRTKSGPALLDHIRVDLAELKRLLFDPRSHQVITAGMEATGWLNEQLNAWLGEKNAADTLVRSAPHNVTSEMGLALLDVADVIRPHPEVVAFLEQVRDKGSIGDGGFLEELSAHPGGPEARDAIGAWLERYGMRCVGEIDITRPRWSERPTTLVPLILGNVRNFAPGAAERRFEQGRREARRKELDLLDRLRALQDGDRKAVEAKRMIDRLRTFIGYREYPKYGMVRRYFIYKQALKGEAERLVRARTLRQQDDIFYLTLPELHDVVRSHHVDDQLIHRRRAAFSAQQALTPPRVLTSDGEVVVGAYRRDDVPAGALVGLPVSAGTVEGRARVIRDVTEAEFDAGDILITAYTDPSWTPAFVTISGLVTEVGGLMTHGAVIAREYGLPAVVGVEGATRLIPDGQRIRVNGTDGYIEILPAS